MLAGATGMAVVQRREVAGLFKAIVNGERASVYLLVGERYLCQEVAAELVGLLLPDERQRQTSLRVVDGENENIQELLAHLKTYGLFQGRQVVRVLDTRLFHTKSIAKNIWARAEKAFAADDMEKAHKALLELFVLAAIEPADWQAEGLASCSEDRWQTVFGFKKPADTEWVERALSVETEAAAMPAVKGGNGADLLADAIVKGLPAENILILSAETVDKRSRLYKLLKDQQTVIDLSVDTGSSTAARKEQESLLRELVQKKLADYGKKIDQRALAMLLDRVGFQPVAAVMEAEKLALYAEGEQSIGVAALDALVGWTREEALYEFTEAFAGRDLPGCFQIMSRMRESGVHALVLLASLRNHLRKLMLARAMQERNTDYVMGMPYGVFQKAYLPRLAAEGLVLPKEIDGHPYAVYKLFQQAERFSLPELQSGLEELLQAEYRLKGSGLPEGIVLEGCLFAICNSGAPVEGHA